MICGAGPVGLLIALRLGQAGIKTIVLERHAELLLTTRAVAYQPVVLNVFRALGILDLIKDHAYLNRAGIFWRDVHGKTLAHLPMPEDEYVLLLGQKRMGDLLLREVAKYASVEVRFRKQFAWCEQDDDGGPVKVGVHHVGTSQTSSSGGTDSCITADWVVGADGANSSVRSSLGLDFDGFSFTEFRMIGVDVYYDFAGEEYDGTVMNFIVDPEDWAVVIYTGQDRQGKPYGHDAPMWRVAYAEASHLSDNADSITARAHERVARYIHGKGGMGTLEIVRAEPYVLHQRCATQAIKGQVLLVGDALHSNNPIGGLGLTTGILDAYAIGNALGRVCRGEAKEELVAEAAMYRRQKWLDTTSKLSMVNYRRLASVEEQDVEEREAFFEKLNTDDAFPGQVMGMFEAMSGKTFAADVGNAKL